jgi:Tfp pilus assembly protein PilF
VDLYDVATGERVTRVGNEYDTVLAADLNSDQTHVALGGPGKHVKIFSTRDARLAHDLKKHTDWVTAIQYSPDSVLLATGDRNGAEQAYRRALEVDARTADAANGLGVLLVEAGRPADAAPWFERAIAAAPDLVEARLNLGIALQQSGQTTRASETYRQVLAAPAHFKRERDAAAKLLAALGEGR